MPLVSKDIAKLMLQYKPLMDLDNQNIIGWPFLQSIGGFNFVEIVDSLDNGHPTQTGHEHICDIIYKKYGEIYD